MDQPKEYFAFISYQRKDEQWADWLRKKLEHYRLPSSLRRTDATLPKEIRPIFRDALELAGGVLAEEIQAALQQSKFLIVVCSPNSAKSPWVNKEVQTFIDLGREERIIPFIIDGTPFSNDPATESFPPALCSLRDERELLGININELGRDAAAVKVVARMFGLKFDALWQRYEREKRRRRWMIIGGSLLFGLVSLGIGAYIVRQNRALDAKNKEVVAERDRANTERDRAEAANKSLQQANDSIRSQYALIEQQKDSISHQKEEIAAERDNVKSANYAMQVNLSRILAEKASKLVDEGDSYLARLIALQGLPPHLPYTTDAEIALRKAASHQTAILYGNQEPVYHVAYRNDGRMIASYTPENVAVAWDAITGKLLWKFGFERGVYARRQNIAFSPDGRYVAVPFRYGIFLLDSQSGRQRAVLQTSDHHSLISTVAFSADGRYLISGSQDKLVRIWEMRSLRERTKLTGHQSGIRVVAFSPNGQLAASVSFDNTVKIWDVRKGQEVMTKEGHSVSFSPDGRIFATAAEDHLVKICDVNTGKELQTFRGHKGEVYSAEFSQDGSRLVSASKDNTIRIWDVQSGDEVRSFSCSTPIHFAAFSPDGQHVVAALDDKSVRIWDVDTRVGHQLLAKEPQYEDARFTSDSKAVVIDDKVVIDLATGRQTRVSASLLATLQTKEEQRKLPIELSDIGESYMYVFSDDGAYFAHFNREGETVDLWHKNKLLWSVPQSTKEGYVFSMTFSPKSQYLWVAPDNETIRLLDVKTGVEIHHFEFPGVANNLTYSPDGRMLAFAVNKTVRVWDGGTFREVYVFEDEDKINNIHFSPDSRRLVSVSMEGTVRVWRIPLLQELIDQTRERFKDRPLTPEERSTYYLE